MHARVGAKGEILLGRNVVADGYAARPVRVVTHAHHDHLKGLRRSVRHSLFIIATPTTLRFLEVLGYHVPTSKAVPLGYDRAIMVEDEVVRLLPARHIAGSAQVLVDSREYRVGYTGDFKMPGTVPMADLDVLVLDATYGDPRRQRRWSDWQALAALVGLVERYAKYGPVWIYGYNGKLQEVMVELRKSGVTLPFYADARTVRLAQIASEFYGIELRQVNIINGGVPEESCVVFQHSRLKSRLRRMPGTHIFLTGWEMRDIVVRTGPTSFNVSYSDHATLKEIVEYLSESRPKLVVVDNYRGKDAILTAKYIENRLGIRALAMPAGSPSLE